MTRLTAYLGGFTSGAAMQSVKTSFMITHPLLQQAKMRIATYLTH